MGTSFSSSTWSAQRSAILRMWIGSSWTFWQQNLPVSPDQQHHCHPSITPWGQQWHHTHLGILLLGDGGSHLTEECAFQRGVGEARNYFIEVPAQTALMGSSRGQRVVPTLYLMGQHR